MTAFIIHHTDHIARSLKFPYPVKPTSDANPNNIISATLLPLPLDFLVDTETIPPESIINATNTQAVPEISPLPSTVFNNPTAHD